MDNFTINTIRERTDIAEIIGQYVKLIQRGQNYVGLCPFHNEKTPSFSVNTAKNIWHCFGCGEGGNVFGFLMKIENISFPDTLKILANRAGIIIEEKQWQQSKEENNSYDILKKAQDVYTQNISSEKAQEYLKSRKISQETSETFQIGYTGAKNFSLYSKLKGEFKDEELLSSGLFIQGTHGIYDRFQERLMFPIIDSQNRIVGFGGRTLINDSAKYINSPDTSVYHKSNHLYALNVARSHIKDGNGLIIVEGYMDAISLYQAGIRNVAAALGTSFTSQQAKLAHRVTDKIYLNFDSDGAGKKAISKAREVLDSGDVMVIVLKDAKDPDEFVSKFSAVDYLKAKEESLPLLKYLIYAKIQEYSSLEKAKNISGEDKAKIIKDCKEILQQQDEVIRQEYIKELSSLLQIDTELLKARFSKYSSVNMQRKQFEYNKQKESKYLKLEKDILAILINDLELRKGYINKITVQDFEDIDNKKIFTLLQEHLIESVDVLLTNESGDISKKIIEFSMFEHITNHLEYLTQCLESLKKRQKESKIDSYKLEINRLEKIGDFDKLKLQQEELNKLIKKT